MTIIIMMIMMMIISDILAEGASSQYLELSSLDNELEVRIRQ